METALERDVGAYLMQLRDDAKTYGSLSILNHWTLAAGVIFLLASGLVIAELLTGPVRGQWIWWHKGIGFVAIFWVLWTLVAHRFHQARPAPDPTYTAFELVARKAMHRVLIVGSLVLGVSGVLMSLFRDRGIDVMGLFAIPGQGEVDWIAGPASVVHQWGGYVMLAAVLGHALAALKHHFVSRDTTLVRMFGRRQPA